MKKHISGIYAWMIIIGIIIGPVGLVFGYPKIAAIGNAIFIAGFLTPTVFTKKIDTTQLLTFLLWFSTVIYFGLNDYINIEYITISLPLLFLSSILSKWSKASFTKQVKN